MDQKCSSCDRPLPEGATFCVGCGAVVEGQTGGSDVTGTIHSLGTTTADSGPIEPIQTDQRRAVDAGKHVLVIVRGPSSGSEIELIGDEMIAGRAPDTAIFLDDITVSRQHARFDLTDQVWQLTDLGSLNGTYVNRARIDSVTLSDGDEIQIGKYRFHFLSGSAGQ